MNAIVVLTPQQLVEIVREAVRAELPNGFSRIRSGSWISIKATGLPPLSVRKLIKDGKIRAAKVGRELRVNADDVEAFMAEASAKPAPEPEPAQVVESVDAFEAARARARARRTA